MIAESLGLDFGLQTIEELRQELSSFGSWNGNKLVKPTVATKDAAKTSVGNAILSTWNLLLDDGALQKGEEHLAGTQRPVVAHMSEKTATDNKLENEEKVIISNSRGSITIKLEIIEMVNDVVWIPSNNHDSKVKSKLGAKEGDVVTIKKGSF
jgi:NADH-quinone oxidoreductase subunit G